jgi:hypothetical protein
LVPRAAGIGRFFLNLAAAEVFPGAFDSAREAARTVSASSRRVGPTQCHGIAGNIEFLLDMHQMSCDGGFLNDALLLARILEAFHGSEMDGLFGFPIVRGSSRLITWSGTLV